MNLNEWREKRRQGEQFTLPSGLVVTLRRVQLLDLAEQGQIPAPLLGLADKLADREVSINLDEFPKHAEVINLVCQACLMEPALEDITELPVSDRLSIWNWSNRVILAVLPFRPEQNGNEGAGHRSEAVREQAEHDPGD